MVALYKTKGKTSEELSQEPGLSIVRDAFSAKETIDSSEIGKFLDRVYRLTAVIFSTPATDAEHSAARKKQWAKTQAKLHVQLQALATEKICAINEFLKFEALVQVKELKGRVSGLELARILQPTTQTAIVSESSSSRKRNQYKPNKDFLTARKKACLCTTRRSISDL